MECSMQEQSPEKIKSSASHMYYLKWKATRLLITPGVRVVSAKLLSIVLSFATQTQSLAIADQGFAVQTAPCKCGQIRTCTAARCFLLAAAYLDKLIVDRWLIKSTQCMYYTLLQLCPWRIQRQPQKSNVLQNSIRPANNNDF